jgi:hypothetical protein
MDTALARQAPLGLEELEHAKIDALELRICALPTVIELPVLHHFTPGLYIRELHSPAGVIATTYIHKQRHPFVLLEGKVLVFVPGRDPVELSAPHWGITEAGTRRVCYVVDPCVWMTFHPTTLTDIDEIERELYDFRELPDGSNVRDRFRDALRKRALWETDQKEIQG